MGLGAGGRTSGAQHVCALASQVRMAILRIIGQLALSGLRQDQRLGPEVCVCAADLVHLQTGE